MTSALLDQMRKLETLIREQVGAGREALSINEFCALENISRSTFEKWRRADIAPVFARFPGMTLQRLSRADYAAWKKKQAKRQREWVDTVAAETATRVERATIAGRISAKGPRHVSKQHKAAAQRRRRRQGSS